jgi:two-component SAPR family response regulator
MKIAILGLSDGYEHLCEDVQRICRHHYRTVQIQQNIDKDCDVVLAASVGIAKEVRKRNDEVPIILLCSSNEEALAGYDITINGYIKKPFSLQEIDRALFEDSG